VRDEDALRVVEVELGRQERPDDRLVHQVAELEDHRAPEGTEESAGPPDRGEGAGERGQPPPRASGGIRRPPPPPGGAGAGGGEGRRWIGEKARWASVWSAAAVASAAWITGQVPARSSTHPVASAAKRNVPADHRRRWPVTQPRDSAG